MKTINRFKQFFAYQIAAIWALFSPKSTMFFFEAYKEKRERELKELADKEL